MFAVGEGFTVMIALPVIFGLGAVTVHEGMVVFVMLTIVYVVPTVGLTLTVAPLVMPLALKFVVPSV